MLEDIYENEDYEYVSWMRQLDTECVKNFGIGIDNLPDQPYYDWYDDGFDVQEAIEEIAEREGLEELI